MQKGIIKRYEMDRPTYNTLEYLTTVRPHRINREEFLVDPFVLSTLEESLGIDVVKEFGDYTRSYYTLEGHYFNLWKYDLPKFHKPLDPRMDEAIDMARKAFRLPRKVKSYRWGDLSSVPFIPSSSAGWGFRGKKGDPGNHALAISRAVLSLNWWLEDEAAGISTFRYHPDLAWTRTQLGTVEDPKIRNVWGKSFDNIILEGITAYPLIEAYRTSNSPMPLGINYFKKLPTIINQTLYDGITYHTGVGLDIKSFDASCHEWLINIAFDILEDNIEFTDLMGYESFRYTRNFFIHTPIVMPDGRMWLKHTGVPSGSYYTQMIDSIINLIINYYAQICHHGQTFNTHVLGDDSLFGVPIDLGIPSIDDYIPHFARLGFTVHPDKSIIATRSDQLSFLGHCARGTRVDRETAGMMRLALYPEHPVNGPAHSINRIKGIMLDSAGQSWPIIHLHNLMMIKWRNEIVPSTDTFMSTEKDWLVAVLAIAEPPSHINEIKTIMLT